MFKSGMMGVQAQVNIQIITSLHIIIEHVYMIFMII